MGSAQHPKAPREQSGPHAISTGDVSGWETQGGRRWCWRTWENGVGLTAEGERLGSGVAARSDLLREVLCPRSCPGTGSVAATCMGPGDQERAGAWQPDQGTRGGQAQSPIKVELGEVLQKGQNWDCRAVPGCLGRGLVALGRK